MVLQCSIFVQQHTASIGHAEHETHLHPALAHHKDQRLFYARMDAYGGGIGGGRPSVTGANFRRNPHAKSQDRAANKRLAPIAAIWSFKVACRGECWAALGRKPVAVMCSALDFRAWWSRVAAFQSSSLHSLKRLPLSSSYSNCTPTGRQNYS
eukprot:SAG31_NODE_941_length_10868_cov_9.232241_6_plen_153_part_00